MTGSPSTPLSLADQRQLQREERQSRGRQHRDDPRPRPSQPTFEVRGRDASRGQSTQPPRREPRPRSRNRQREDNSDGPPGRPFTPIPGTNISRVCLIVVEPPTEQSIPNLVTEHRGERHRHPKVNQPGHPFDGKPVCYDYITKDKGCRRRSTCAFAHLDIDTDDSQSLRPAVHQDIKSTLDLPTVRQHFHPSQEFTTLLATL